MATINWEKVLKTHEPITETRRKPHFMKRQEHKPQTPTRAVFFDSESIVDPVTKIHTPYIICARFINYNTKKQREPQEYGAKDARKRLKSLEPIESFWSDVVDFTQDKKPTYIFAHNLGYDLLVTNAIPALFEMGYAPLGSPYEKGQVFIWEIARPNKERFCQKCNEERPCKKCQKKRRYTHNMILLSTTNFYQGTLASLGKVFDLHKTNQDTITRFDFGRLTEYNINEVLDYCHRDVEIIAVAMSHLFKACEAGRSTGFGGFKKTLPSMSLASFMTWHVPPDTVYLNDDVRAIQLERESYYGGRTEVWKRRVVRERIYQLDINSMYPYVMKESLFPTRLIRFSEEEDVKGLSEILGNGFLVTAKVKLRSDSNPYPLRWEGKLVCPTGTFITTLSTPELKYALEHDHLKEVITLAAYDKYPLFESFVGHFYQARQEAKKQDNKIMDTLFKLVMNSLYGKFGQLSKEWVEVGECEVDMVNVEEIYDHETRQRFRLKYFGGRIYTEEPSYDVAYNSFVSIAAHVTAYARMLLWGYILVAGIENHFYNDTDSLFVNETGYKNLSEAGLISDTELGALAVEAISDSPSYFRRPKDYIFNGSRTLKGVGKEGLTKYGTVFNTVQWPKLRSAIREGRISGFQNKDVRKVLSPSYSKGWVKSNGDVEPLKFDVIEGKNVLMNHSGNVKMGANQQLLRLVEER